MRSDTGREGRRHCDSASIGRDRARAVRAASLLILLIFRGAVVPGVATSDAKACSRIRVARGAKTVVSSSSAMEGATPKAVRRPRGGGGAGGGGSEWVRGRG